MDDMQRGVYFRFAAKIPKLTQTMSTVYPIMTTVLALTTLAPALNGGYCSLQSHFRDCCQRLPTGCVHKHN